MIYICFFILLCFAILQSGFFFFEKKSLIEIILRLDIKEKEKPRVCKNFILEKMRSRINEAKRKGGFTNEH